MRLKIVQNEHGTYAVDEERRIIVAEVEPDMAETLRDSVNLYDDLVRLGLLPEVLNDLDEVLKKAGT